MHVEARGQLPESVLFFHLYVGSGDGTLVARVARQVPLFSEPSHQLHLSFVTISEVSADFFK